MTRQSAGYRNFRLNLEQQRKRAKELLGAARAGDVGARERIDAHGNPGRRLEPRLADAQRAIAGELRFESWAALKRHIELMTQARMAIEASGVPAPGEALDGDKLTLHVRCGSDLREPLTLAGFGGNFYEHSYPYLIGPVREGPGCIEQRARFIVDSYGGDGPGLEFESVLEGLEEAERQLRESARYERVVIWSERDCYDQLVLARLLGHYARGPRPESLELINLAEFPGAVPFIGLGQLPPEALRMLWSSRAPAGRAGLELGLAAWQALTDSDPRALAAIVRGGTPALPLLGPALHRHIRELPSIENGLSLTESMALGRLAAAGTSLRNLFAELTFEIDPLPGQGDLQVRDRVLAMERSTPPLIARRPGDDPRARSRPPWTDVLTITGTGRAVLDGVLDYRSLAPPPRWVGGVEIGGANRDWRWDEAARRVVLGPHTGA